MKVLVNGGINLSELDGWWAEAYAPEVGWALGDGREHGDDPAWVARMRESMACLTPRSFTNRAVREYTEQYYLPAASAYRERPARQRTIRCG